MSERRRLSRRAVLVSTAALAFCLAPLLLPAAEPVPTAKLDNPFFAMDTAIGGGTPDAQAKMLKELGYAGMSCDLNRDIATVLKALDDRELKLFAVYAGATLGPGGPSYHAKLPQVVQQLKGRDTIVWLTINGKAPNAEEQAVKVVREVADLAGAAGLRVALYPHAGFYIARVEDAVRIAKKAERPNVGVTFNLCHWLKEAQPENMLEDIQGAAPHLFVVTVNGADRHGTSWKQLIQPLDRGDFDVREFLMALRKAGFRGPVGFQGYGIGGDAQENLRRTMAAWQEFARPDVRRLSVDEYVDKMKGGWIGQMAGVGWAGPTEWWCRGEIMAAERAPKWNPGMVNQFGQDDIYVEMTFLRTLEVHGLDVSIRQAGIDFANSRYWLACANDTARKNLRKGIAPPDSSHPKFNPNADDIDYQIEADYSGLIAPGMPQLVIELGEKFGRLMNYGDGMYAGQFVGAMYTEAFFQDDMVKIIEAGLRCIPAESQYAEMVRDMLAWYEKNPDDWQQTWQWVEEKYHKDPKYSHGLWNLTKPAGKGAQSIDAKLNGAYILMGLLYGKGDPDQTILISMRCGQDSDCNPSNAAGILFTTMGFEKVPGRFKSALDPRGKFSHTPYDFPTLIEVSKKLVRQAVARSGGRIEKADGDAEVFVIPVVVPKPSKLERSWEPGPIAGSKFTDEEKAQITAN